MGSRHVPSQGKTWRRLVTAAALGAVAVAVPISSAGSATVKVSSSAARTTAATHAAAKLGVSAGALKAVASSTARFPLTGVTLVEYKFLAPDGRSVLSSVNARTGTVADSAAAQAAERQARFARYGKLEPSLYAKLHAKPGTSVGVAVWAAMAAPDRKMSPAALDRIAKNAQRPIAEALRALGAKPEMPQAVPFVLAKLNASQADALQARADVTSIDMVPSGLKVMLDDSATSNRFPYVWGNTTGTGSKVAVHEDDGVDNVNSFLNNGTHGVTYWSPGSPNIGSHATEVAGVMASTNAWRRGGSFATGQILSANFQSFANTANMVNSANWAASNGASVINMSWGGCTSGAPNFFSRWLDFEQKALGATFVVSSGNTPNCGGSIFVASPSLGWNTTSVGSYWDHNTGLRTDDTESSFTEWQNPTDPNSGRTYEKPDVTAHGGEFVSPNCFGVETTGVGGGVAASTCGTSFSAPDTSALIADISQRLGGAPEAKKAIVMAGATHNIRDGFGYTNCSTSPIPGDCLDGAGAIDAKQTIQNVQISGNFRQTLDSPSTLPAGANRDIAVALTAGKPFRAALVWDSTATCADAVNGNCASDVLNADLDLDILDPSNTLVAASASFQNSAEVVDFTPSVSGTYTIRIHSFRFDAGTNTFVGLAWNKNTGGAVTPLTKASPIPVNTLISGQTTDKGHSYWDTYSGASCDGFLASETGLEKVYKFKTTSSGTLSGALSSIVGFPGVGADVDIILLRQTGVANSQNTQVLACGDATFNAGVQPAGRYLVVVDGFSGSVANYSIQVSKS
jgi:hypothetical protein